jgi:hypothetical protein
LISDRIATSLDHSKAPERSGAFCWDDFRLPPAGKAIAHFAAKWMSVFMKKMFYFNDLNGVPVRAGGRPRDQVRAPVLADYVCEAIAAARYLFMIYLFGIAESGMRSASYR